MKGKGDNEEVDGSNGRKGWRGSRLNLEFNPCDSRFSLSYIRWFSRAGRFLSSK